jgi:hypothetical protein
VLHHVDRWAGDDNRGSMEAFGIDARSRNPPVKVTQHNDPRSTIDFALIGPKERDNQSSSQPPSHESSVHHLLLSFPISEVGMKADVGGMGFLEQLVGSIETYERP